MLYVYLLALLLQGILTCYHTGCIHVTTQDTYMLLHGLHTRYYTGCIHVTTRGAYTLLHRMHTRYYMGCIHVTTQVHTWHIRWPPRVQLWFQPRLLRFVNLVQSGRPSFLASTSHTLSRMSRSFINIPWKDTQYKPRQLKTGRVTLPAVAFYQLSLQNNPRKFYLCKATVSHG